jgi:DNA gyrase subunit A
VRIINLREGDVIASVMAVPVSEDEEVATDAIVAEGAESAPAEATAEAAVEAPQTEVNE